MHRSLSSLFFRVFAVTSLLAAAPASAALTLDTSFDGDGFALVNFADNLDSARDVAIDGEGNAVLVGMSRNADRDYLAVARLDTNGVLDTTFDDDGLLTLLPGGQPALYGGADGRAVAIQPEDGKIVIAGSWNDNTGQGYRIMVARLMPDGSLDAGFGDAGVLLLGFSEVFSAVAEAVALDADGRILVAGGSNDPGTVRGFVLRLTSAGDLDATFGGDGLFSFENPTTPGVPITMKTVQPLPGGKILAAGGTDDLVAVRLTAEGALDTTFSGDGIAEVNIAVQDFNGFLVKSYEDTYACAVQPDGRILLGGLSMASGTKAVLARLTSSGTLDASFGDGGIYKIPNALNNSSVYDIALRDGGDFVIAGLNLPPRQLSQNANSEVKFAGSFPPQAIHGLVTLSDGRVVGAGEQPIGGLNYEFVAMRLGAGDLPEPDCTMCGEVSGDCRISAGDALTALKMAVGQQAPDAQADMDGNGKVTAGDALKILRIAVGSDVATEDCKNGPARVNPDRQKFY